MALTGVVHRQHERVDVRQGPREGIGDVGRERGDSAVPGQVVAEDGESLDGMDVARQSDGMAIPYIDPRMRGVVSAVQS